MNNLREFLKNENLTSEEVDKVLETVKPLDDFYKYMLETYKKDKEAVDKESEEFSYTVFNEYMVEISKAENKIQGMLSISGDIMKRYANKYDYTDSENVKIAINKMIEVMFKYQINENNNKK